MGRAFEAITALGMIGVMFAVGSLGFAMWLVVGLLEKLPWFQTDADRAKIAADAAASRRAASASSGWTPWVIGAERVLLISVCLALALLLLGGAGAFVWKRILDAQVVWPRAGVYPVPREALRWGADGQPLLGEHTADEYWATERANATRQLPPVRQDVHVTGIPKDQVADAIEAHHEAPPFGVLQGEGQYGREAKGGSA